MLVQAQDRAVTRGNTGTEHNFTIKASAKAFTILAGSLYSDKPLAIIRELCCNAYDSHVEAGKAATPIEVILPSRLNPTLTIRDFGIGLDHDGIINIYSKFFESTKTESNDFVGQLGLGSKAPFSMFKTFTVEARKNGVQCVYAVYTNEDGVPSLTKMSECDTTECNGVAVSMSCKQDDFDKFYNAAKRALMYFDPKPVVNGVHNFETYYVKHGVGGSNWKIRESEYWARMSGPYAIQGFVVYPIDGALMREHDMSPAARVISNQNIDIWMPIGSVDVAPSREALSYDKRTIANIVAQFEMIADEMRAVIEADFNASKSAYEAGCKLWKYAETGDYSMRNLFESMNSHKAFKWNGKEITFKHPLDVTKIKSTVICRAQSTGKKLQYSSRYEPTTIDTKRVINLNSNVVVLIDDVFKSSGDIVKQYLDDPKTNTSTAVILKATKKAEYNEKEIKGILKMLGDAPALKISSLPYTASKSGYKASGRAKEDRLQFTGFLKNKSRYNSGIRRVFSSHTWQRVSVDLSKGGFYMPVDRFTIVHNNRDVICIDDIIAGAVNLGLLTEDERTNKVFGFNEKEIKALNGDPKWQNLFTYLEDQFNAKNLVSSVVEANASQQLEYAMSDFNRHIGKYWNKYEPTIVDGAFKAFVTKARALHASAPTGADTVNSFITHMGLNSDIPAMSSKRADALVKEWNALLKAHAMLKMVQWSWLDSDDAPIVIDYINTLAIK
jgi:hypothetical protein